MKEYERKAEAYAAAVAKLVEQLGVVSDIEYERLNQRAELARYASRDARAALELHLTEHRCQNAPEKAS